MKGVAESFPERKTLGLLLHDVVVDGLTEGAAGAGCLIASVPWEQKRGLVNFCHRDR
jgi:hypothetical protein